MASTDKRHGPRGGSDGADRPTFISNPHISSMEADVLYHLALDNKKFDLTEMFSDVKFVCLGGSPDRMKQFAEYLVRELPHRIETGQTLTDIAGGTDRYVLYKHGMGVPSLSIILHELFKLLHHAGCTDVVFFRVGTSGGIGVPPGSVVVSESVLDGFLQPYMTMPILGEEKKFPAHLDESLIEELMAGITDQDDFQTFRGKTLCTDDFYEGQGRLDGAFCEYAEKDKMEFLRKLAEKGVKNIEMESVCFAAMCQRANIRGAIVCVTLLDRLKGDQVKTPHQEIVRWTLRPEAIITRYIKSHLPAAYLKSQGK